MGNINPIKTKDDGKYTEFIIQKASFGDLLYLKTKTSLDKTGWKLDLIHTVTLDGDPIEVDPDPNADIAELKVGEINTLNGLKLSIVSSAGRIRDGGDGDPALVDYMITFYDEKNNKIDEFPAKSSITNPEKFYTKIIIKVI